MTAKHLKSLLALVPDDCEIIAMADGYESIVDALVMPGAVLLGTNPITEILDGDTGQIMDPVTGHMAALISAKNESAAEIWGDF